MNNYNKICISFSSSILSALKQMDNVGLKLLVVTKHTKVHGVLSIGDIQRAIIANKLLDTPINEIMRKDVRVAKVTDDLNQEKERMRLNRNEFMPIVSEEGELVDIIFWKDLFNGDKNELVSLNLPVVIMAGGKGTRLKPLTNVLPKALIPVGEYTILEEIMHKFINVGCDDFYLSVNYKADLIKHYFSDKKFKINYIEESKPLGTAGSLFLLKDKIHSTFFVSNCDIIVNQDFREVYNFHKENNNLITIISVLKHYKIPYGTIETRENGLLEKLIEKPELTFQINSGVYILEPSVLDEIPHNTYYHITEAIEQLRQQGKNVGVFPVSEGSWKDIGEWNEYFKTIKGD